MATIQKLPATIQTRLDELVGKLAKTCGANLVGLVAHGSAVRGGYREGASDIDLVCILDEDSAATLAAIGPALELARFAARIETMILTKAEIARSADCFPLLYGDLARSSATLHGVNPFEGLAISDAHKRLRIEQELREIRIRLRRVATDFTTAQNFGGAVERKIKQARGPLWALLALRGETVDDDLDSVLRATGKAYEIEPAPLRNAREDAKAAYATLAKLLDAALADVDTREVKA
jgi:hypothetical protein